MTYTLTILGLLGLSGLSIAVAQAGAAPPSEQPRARLFGPGWMNAFGVGLLEAPPDAQVLIADAQGRPVMAIKQASSRARKWAHGGRASGEPLKYDTLSALRLVAKETPVRLEVLRW